MRGKAAVERLVHEMRFFDPRVYNKGDLGLSALELELAQVRYRRCDRDKLS